MATHTERLMVLQMVQERRITASEGAQLIEALGAVPGAQDADGGAVVTRPRWVRVRVTDAESGGPRANLRLPVGLVASGIKAGARLVPEIGGIELQRLLAAIEAGELGGVVDELDANSGRRVEISLE